MYEILHAHYFVASIYCLCSMPVRPSFGNKQILTLALITTNLRRREPLSLKAHPRMASSEQRPHAAASSAGRTPVEPRTCSCFSWLYLSISLRTQNTRANGSPLRRQSSMVRRRQRGLFDINRDRRCMMAHRSVVLANERPS